VPEKCPDILIKAFQSLQQSGWKLVLVGGTSDTGEYTQQLVNLAEKSTDVVFAGQLQGARLAEILQGAGLFVLPCELEGLPLAMLEAMQAGVPVLASDIPVHKRLIDQKRGILFTVNDQDSCARCLDWAIHHPQELAVMVRNAQEYVKAFYNWDDITTKTWDLYNQLLPMPHPESASAGTPLGAKVSCQ
jgi:glycosyltransferase involved in cell wall biosynthesis